MLFNIHHRPRTSVVVLASIGGRQVLRDGNCSTILILRMKVLQYIYNIMSNQSINQSIFCNTFCIVNILLHALYQDLVVSFFHWRETLAGDYGRNHVGILSEKYNNNLCKQNFKYFKQGGLDDYERAMYAALIGDLDHVSSILYGCGVQVFWISFTSCYSCMHSRCCLCVTVGMTTCGPTTRQ